MQIILLTLILEEIQHKYLEVIHIYLVQSHIRIEIFNGFFVQQKYDIIVE